MRPIFLCLFTLLTICTAPSYAIDPLTRTALQTEDNTDMQTAAPFKIHGQAGIWSFTMPLADRSAFGAGMDVQLWYSPRFAVGFSGSFSIGGIHNDLGYTAGEPRLGYYDLNIYQELKCISSKHLGLNLRFYTGVGNLYLKDKSILETYTSYDEFGNATEEQRPLTVAKASFYRLAPALAGHFNLGKAVETEAVAGYNFFCNAAFGNRNNFNGYFVQLGFKFGRS